MFEELWEHFQGESSSYNDGEYPPLVSVNRLSENSVEVLCTNNRYVITNHGYDCEIARYQWVDEQWVQLTISGNCHHDHVVIIMDMVATIHQ